MLEIISLAVYGKVKFGSFERLRTYTGIADSTEIFVLNDDYVVHVSNPNFPQSAARRAERNRTMRAALGPEAHVLPDIVADGYVEGKSFLVLPKFKPLREGFFTGKFDRLRVRRNVIDWLYRVAALDAPNNDARPIFARSLCALSSFPGISAEIARAAHQADIDKAQFVPMHGDLWSANVLRDGDEIRIIDWGGAEACGYGVYDLIRAAASFGMSARSLNRELSRHSAILGGSKALQLHLLGALGHYAQNLGQFPPERFISLSARCWTRFICSC